MSAGFNLGMLKKAQQARAQQKKYQDMLAGVVVHGQSKNSRVKVVVNGTQKLQSITIDPALITFIQENYISKGIEDNMLSKAIMEAVDDAMQKVQMEIVKKMQESGNMDELMAMLGGGN